MNFKVGDKVLVQLSSGWEHGVISGETGKGSFAVKFSKPSETLEIDGKMIRKDNSSDKLFSGASEQQDLGNAKFGSNSNDDSANLTRDIALEKDAIQIYKGQSQDAAPEVKKLLDHVVEEEEHHIEEFKKQLGNTEQGNRWKITYESVHGSGVHDIEIVRQEKMDRTRALSEFHKNWAGVKRVLSVELVSTSDRPHTPIVSEAQAGFFGAELARLRRGEKTESGMSEAELVRHLEEWGGKKNSLFGTSDDLQALGNARYGSSRV